MIIGGDFEASVRLTTDAHGAELDEAAEIETDAGGGDVVWIGPEGKPTDSPPGGTPELPPELITEILTRPEKEPFPPETGTPQTEPHPMTSPTSTR